MRRVQFTFFLVTVSCLSLLNTAIAANGDLKAKPNTIFILADDLGFAQIGCYGDTRIGLLI